MKQNNRRDPFPANALHIVNREGWGTLVPAWAISITMTVSTTRGCALSMKNSIVISESLPRKNVNLKRFKKMYLKIYPKIGTNVSLTGLIRPLTLPTPIDLKLSSSR